MANVSYLRPAGKERGGRKALPGSALPGHRGPRGRHMAVGGLLLVVVLLAAAAIVLVSSSASLTADQTALASVGLPLGGGKIESVTVTSGPHAQPIPVRATGDPQIWPERQIPVNTVVSIDVVVKRPGWIAWLAGSTEHIHLTMTTPSAAVSSPYLTLRGHAPLKVRFAHPVRTVSYGTPGNLRRHVLSGPQTSVTLPRSSSAGTIDVAGAPRTWETAKPSVVSWFPSGANATAVASPAPGSKIRSTTPITLTFNKPVAQALGSSRPPVTPDTPGTWHTVNDHTISFHPLDYGYGLGTSVNVGLPKGVKLVGGSGSGGSWTVPGGSPLRLQQLLAILGYLPLKFKYSGSGVRPTPQAELNAAIHPPAGHFTWRYRNTPSPLRNMWAPGAYGTMTEGALMAFENDHGLATVGLSNPLAWKYLIQAAIAGHGSSFGYTFVMVSKESSPESLTLWHNGHDVLTTPVNTGIASAPTASGTFPVYEHLRVGTMSGTNPDGSHYDDPGIQFISYFNGGDALHAFTRAEYGFPQSLGCVEMSLGPAGQVWPYTPIGTLVQVT